jgi:hypothetical protein
MIKAAPAIESTPNRLRARADEPIRQADIRNGKASVATVTPRVGCGLKLKYAVSENGRENISIMPDAASHIGNIAITIRTDGNLLVL